MLVKDAKSVAGDYKVCMLRRIGRGAFPGAHVLQTANQCYLYY